MAIPKLSLKVIIFCIIFATIGALWGSHAAGLINLNPILADLPVVGKYFSKEIAEETPYISPLEEENKQLRDRISQLEKELAESVLQETSLQKDIEEYKVQISEVESEKRFLEEKEKKAAMLAELYQNMKPKDIAPIFDNLDDDLIVSILAKIDANQAAKIIAELDPIRAAKLTKTITDIDNNSNN